MRDSAQFTSETRFNLRTCSYLPCSLSYSTSTAPSSTQMNCTSIPGTARSGDSVNNFLENNYAHRSAKDLINIYLNFSPRRRSIVSAKIWMNTDRNCSERNIFQGSDRSPRCANFSSAFTTITNKSCSPVQAKRVTPNITLTC